MAQLIIAAILGIAAIIALIVWAKVHPFIALMLGSALMATVAGMGYKNMFASFTTGVGSTMAGVGLLVVFGAVTGRFLVSSGGAEVIVDTILDRTSHRALPWAIAGAAFIVGIPLFFEVGVVILIPIVMYAAKRAKMPVMLLGIPALAGLSTLHAFVPPHPGPLVAIQSLGANLGLTLGLGLLVAIPTVIVSGPLLGRIMARWVPVEAHTDMLGDSGAVVTTSKPRFGTALSVVLLPVVLMLLATVVELSGAGKNPVGAILVFLGEPLVALLVTTLVAMWVLGLRRGLSLKHVSDQVGQGISSIAGVILIVGAGGGFKQTLVDSGIADTVAQGIVGSGIPILLAGWLVAMLVRVSTGSATVATITAAGIMQPVMTGLPAVDVALVVLAIGAGSVFLSHVNDAGFWLIKEYFGLTVGQTFKTWSLMESVLSVVGLAAVSLVGVLV